MPKWKQFIQGDNLHEEHLKSSDTTPVVQKPNLSGKEIRQEYEAIINEPSASIASSAGATLLTASESEPSKSKKCKNRPVQQLPVKIVKPKPTNGTLFGLCESNNLEELSYYFDNYGSDLVPGVNNIVDDYGWTLLMSAACAGSNSIVEYLLEVGADINQTEKSGLTALDLAMKKNKLNTCELIRNWVVASEQRLQNPDYQEADEDAEEPVEDSVPKFCTACATEITSERRHNNCIAHLLSTSSGASDRIHYGLPESNKGFQLMLKNGWNRNRGLGVHGQGQKFPVKTVLKRDREGFGVSTFKEARVTHFGPFDPAAVENPNRQKREKTVNKELLETLEKRARTKEANFRREFYSID